MIIRGGQAAEAAVPGCFADVALFFEIDQVTAPIQRLSVSPKP